MISAFLAPALNQKVVSLCTPAVRLAPKSSLILAQFELKGGQVLRVERAQAILNQFDNIGFLTKQVDSLPGVYLGVYDSFKDQQPEPDSEPAWYVGLDTPGWSQPSPFRAQFSGAGQYSIMLVCNYQSKAVIASAFGAAFIN